MNGKATFDFGLVKCSTHTIPDLLDEVRTLLFDKSLHPRTINFVNAHVYNLATKDHELRQNLNRSRIVAADGISVVWAARLFGAKMVERCNMTEAFRAFLHDTQMLRNNAILIGAHQAEVEKAAQNMTKSSVHCRIIRAVSGFADDSEYSRVISECGNIDFIFVGMGSPKSERFVHFASEICPQAIIWHIGGGTIRFYAGTLKEAPVWLRRCGLQWLHRLCSEPRRMWKRYFIGNPKFIYLILKEYIRNTRMH